MAAGGRSESGCFWPEVREAVIENKVKEATPSVHGKERRSQVKRPAGAPVMKRPSGGPAQKKQKEPADEDEAAKEDEPVRAARANTPADEDEAVKDTVTSDGWTVRSKSRKKGTLKGKH
jgi:hypothetical protein